MLSVMYGVSAMIPLTFGVAGYALVSRTGDIPSLTVTPQRLTTTELTTWRGKNVDPPTD